MRNELASEALVTDELCPGCDEAITVSPAALADEVELECRCGCSLAVA